MDDLLGDRSVENVRIEAQTPVSGEPDSSSALLRRDDGGRFTLTPVAAESGAGEAVGLAAGRVVLLVRDDDPEARNAPAVRVTDGVADAAGAVVVELLEGARHRRPVRDEDRFEATGLPVQLQTAGGTRNARLHDVSVQGLRISYQGDMLPDGAEAGVSGELTDESAVAVPWSLIGVVAWTGRTDDGTAVSGIRVNASQRKAAVRLVRWARRATDGRVGGA